MAVHRFGLTCFAILMAGVGFWFTGCQQADDQTKPNTAQKRSADLGTQDSATTDSAPAQEASEVSGAELDLRAPGSAPAILSPSPIVASETSVATETAVTEVVNSAETDATTTSVTGESPVAGVATSADGSNKLADGTSPYLRNAAKSPVHWYPWGEEAFTRAKDLDRPVLIDSGAAWCHWCHVMDNGTYSDPEVVRLLNENFVAVKIDRDERPDVDERYQAAHFLVNQKSGGWPLTVFALPDGRAFESLTYVPAETKGTQVGMRDILKQVLSVYKERRPEVEKQAEQIQTALTAAGKKVAARGTADRSIFNKIAQEIKTTVDKENGGFGSAAGPKFPQGNALLFLLQYYVDTQDKDALDIVSRALTAYFKGGLRDQVLGGYFRYATDGKFGRPHYEKLLYVQAELLSAFSIAYAATEKKMFKEAAEEILAFSRETLENPEGGFYASQDADMAPGDDGAYYTWTAEEVRSIAGEGVETDVFLHYMNVGADQNTNENGRSTLRSDKPLQASADAYKVTYNEAQAALNNVRKKLRDARMKQDQFPYVDKSIIASWNALMIRGYLDAFRYCGDEQAKEFALKSANFILEKMVSPEEGVAHVMARGIPGQYGLLEDQVLLAAALVSCYENSSKKEYLETAESLMQYVEKTFLDADTGLYVDRVSKDGQIGLLKVNRFAVFDNPTPAPNPLAAITWYKLFEITNNNEYKTRYSRLVNAVAGHEISDGLAAATYGRAVGIGLQAAPPVAAEKPATEEGGSRATPEE